MGKTGLWLKLNMEMIKKNSKSVLYIPFEYIPKHPKAMLHFSGQYNVFPSI